MTIEEFYQEIEEQSEYEYNQIPLYDDATYAPVELDYTTQS